jgi:class 3 adenylate cyclase
MVVGPGDSSDQKVARGLAAILEADVVNYSRLMHADEVGAIAALKSSSGVQSR